MEKFDLVIIGSGPGGYVAAIKAAKLGMKTAIVERADIGGTCLNRGCIPTKTLIHSAQLYQEAKTLKDIGIHYEGVSFHMEEVQNRKDEVVLKIRQGIVQLLEANGVTILQGNAMIARENKVRITKAKKDTNMIDPSNIEADETEANKIEANKTEAYKIEANKTEANKTEAIEIETNKIKTYKIKTNEIEISEIEADKILIATGSKPVIPKIDGVNLPNVITSDELLSRRSLYKKLLIIGGGVIGIEFASIYSNLGCEVEIIEAMDRIIPNMDKEISQSIAMNLKKKGVIIHTKSLVTRISEDLESGGLRCEYEEKGQIKTSLAEGILLSVGRKANTQDLFSSDLAMELEGTCIKVNEDFETSIKGIYAIGDAIKGKQLAHAASAEGITAVERMYGREPSIDLSVIPACIYTTPEVASVGLSEEEALACGYTVKSGKYPMLGNCKTLIAQGDRGFIRVICEEGTDKILGAQLLCDRATDMIGEFAAAISLGLTSKEMASVIRPHPTYSEAITEAVEDAWGMAIHLMPKKSR